MYYVCDNLKVIRNNYITEETGYVIDSMIEGNTPFIAYVDDLDDPNISVVWDKGHGIYFGGKGQSEDYLKAGEFVREHILNSDNRSDIGIAKIYFPTEKWHEALLECFKEFSPGVYCRSLYRHNLENIPNFDDENKVLVKEIDKETVNNQTLENREMLEDEIIGMWGSVDRFFQGGFGSCAIKENDIACWCTAEYMSSSFCSLGIETVEQYQGKGIATITTLNALKKCRDINKMPYWDSWKSNTPSVRLAEKTGFEKICDYEIMLLRFY